jgi:hypothetical protein
MMPDCLTHSGIDRQRRSRGGRATAIKRRAKGKERRQAEDELLSAVEAIRRQLRQEIQRSDCSDTPSPTDERAAKVMLQTSQFDLDRLADALGVDGLDSDDIVKIVRRARKRQRDEGILPRKFHRTSKKK